MPFRISGMIFVRYLSDMEFINRSGNGLKQLKRDNLVCAINALCIVLSTLFPAKSEFTDTPTYNRLIAKALRNNGETCRWWPSIPKDHNPAPENSQRQGWTNIDKIDVNWKIESIPVLLTLYYFHLNFIFVKISQIKLFSYAFGVLIRKFSIF